MPAVGISTQSGVGWLELQVEVKPASLLVLPGTDILEDVENSTRAAESY